jgi:nucleoside-diphosphate-sugar epimerase
LEEPANVQFVILGCGYTGRRVAERLLARGLRVLATTRSPERLRDLAARGVTVVRMVCEEPETLDALRERLEPERRTLYSIPTGLEQVRPLIQGRLVYFSTTSVYGTQHFVDERTEPHPATPRQMWRRREEQFALQASPSTLILRPAAIYGPDRGVHAALRDGTHRLFGDGSNYVSRIHADDLAAHAEAALFSALTGAFPVADNEPCRAHDIAAYCARLLRVPPPPSGQPAAAEDDTRQADRRVDGRAIRAALGITLLYPDYRAGIQAALAAPRSR